MSADWERNYIAVQGDKDALDVFAEEVKGPLGSLDFNQIFGVTPPYQMGLSHRLHGGYKRSLTEPFHGRFSGSNFKKLRLEEMSYSDSSTAAAIWATGYVLQSKKHEEWGQINQYSWQLNTAADAEPVGEVVEAGDPRRIIPDPEQVKVSGVDTLRFSLFTRRYIPFHLAAKIARIWPGLYVVWASRAPSDCWEGPEDCFVVAEALASGGEEKDLKVDFSYILPKTPTKKVERLENILGIDLSYDGDGEDLDRFPISKKDPFASFKPKRQKWAEEEEVEEEEEVDVDLALTEDFRTAKAPKDHKPLKSMVSLVDEAKALTEEYKALSKRVQSLNKKLAKADPDKDKWTARDLMLASEELHNQEELANVYSALSIDAWQKVSEIIEQARDLYDSGETIKAFTLLEAIGYESSGSSLDGVLKRWNDLKETAEKGILYHGRHESYCAELQSEFYEVLEKVGLEPPFPHASEGANW